MPAEEQTCFNCGKPGHRAKECKLPDKRKQGNGGRALAVTADRANVFLGVVTSDAPIPIGTFPTQQPGAQAGRKQAAKQLIGAQRLKVCNDTSCTVIHNPGNIHNIPRQPSMICTRVISRRGR